MSRIVVEFGRSPAAKMNHSSHLSRMAKPYILLKFLIGTLSRRKQSLSLVVTALTVVGLVVLSSGAIQLSLFNPQPAFAQRPNPRDNWRRVYEQLPDLPLENQYVSKETGKVNADSTLVNRLIEYHVYVKGRAPNYRLDWKLTMADYLGANELMLEEVYPGHETLQESPIAGDRAVIERLSRQQRDALVQTLVSIFNPNYPTPTSTTPSPTPL